MVYAWKPIEPLSDRDRSIDFKDIDSLEKAWFEVKSKLAETSANNLQKFVERLARLWSIETGILERIYDIDRGTTEILIEHGFLASLIERSSTSQDPEQLIEILRDHRAAVDLIQDCVANSRLLTVGFIHELHSILTRHQLTVHAVDQFGNRVSFPLSHGKFKELPNNPTRPDGTVHEYCPPIHVASEMDGLLEMYGKYTGENPILLSAWLHHRFTQIHPYSDGNGRVARALANLVLVKANLFPVAITRDQRAEYIEALEKADEGNLQGLSRLFADVQKKTILQALSVGPDTKPMVAVVQDVADSIAFRLRRKKEEAAQRLRQVNAVARSLQQYAADHLRSVLIDTRSRFKKTANVDIASQVLSGGPGQLHNEKPTEHWYHYQVTKTAQQANQRVNFEEDHYFVRARLSREGLPWLTYVVSLHHIGQELTGVMEITALLEISYPSSDEESPKSEPIMCMEKPFTITFNDQAEEVKSAFLDWVNESFAIALTQWGNVL